MYHLLYSILFLFETDVIHKEAMLTKQSVIKKIVGVPFTIQLFTNTNKPVLVTTSITQPPTYKSQCFAIPNV